MSETFDGPWKQAVEEALPLVLALFYPDVHAAIDWTQDCTPVTQELHNPAGGASVRVDCFYCLARLDSDD